jgi:hypothetical protein
MYLYYNPVLSTPIYDNRNVQIEFLPLEEKVGRKKRGGEEEDVFAIIINIAEVESQYILLMLQILPEKSPEQFPNFIFWASIKHI